ncbi:solute carrier family 30 (zinc transporter), member 1 [Kwoniella heveanensis CBS 569]|nr:solute carrier family 30 (zinc transporter), member 1 [Kwoniella heveanensis CBS 569]
MGLSRSARIITLLVIDTLFFFVELIAGYAVGSLALVADSFHMLNDVLSLVVALYTIKLATSPSSNANSYGWQRAEILGALINGVFLVALCVSIFLEAIGRIVSPPEISNAKVIVVVGSLGLLSNIVGLFLFHEHGHSHGHSHGAIQLPDDDDQSDDGPERENSVSDLYQHPAETRAQIIETAQEFGYGQSMSRSLDDGGIPDIKSPPAGHHRALSASRRSKRHSLSRPKEIRKGSASRVPPAAGQNDTLPPVGESASSSASAATAVTQSAPAKGRSPSPHSHDHDHEHSHDHDHDHEHDHDEGNNNNLASNASDAEAGHGHSHDHGHGGHGHSHGSMNMQGVFLHVMGDALGNVGVIAAGLVIWFCEGRWTLYFDPGVSLVITCIILSSALPLCKSASYILLQGVPSHVSLEAVRKSISNVDGVDSVHELHIWQLSESTVVASVHVLIVPGVDYMNVANGIRQRMHGHGIHSVTIQPEFYPDEEAVGSINGDACLIRCPPDQCQGDTCCPPKAGKLVEVEEHTE